MRRRLLLAGVGVVVVAGALTTWWSLPTPGPFAQLPPPRHTEAETAALREELTAINLAYSKLDRFTMRVRYTVRREDGTELERQEGEVRRTPGATWWTMGATAALSTPTIHLTIHRETRSIVVRPPLNAPTTIQDAAAFASELQTIVGRCERAELGPPGEIRTLVLACPGSAYTRAEVRIRPDHLMTAMVLASPPRAEIAGGAPVTLEIAWDPIDLAPPPASEPPTVDAILGGGTPIGEYAGFELVDLRGDALE